MKKTTISGQVTEDIRQAILTGQLAPHDRLREADLAEKYGVSRTPIREALNTLANAGLVKFIPYCGAEVATINLEEIKEIYQVRKVLEGLVVELAAPFMKNKNCEKLLEYIENMDAAIAHADYQSYSQIHEEFHHYIYNFCPNSYLKNMTTELMALSASFRRSSWITLRNVNLAQDYHHKIYEAIKSGNATGAKVANEKHIELILKELG